MVRQSVNCNEWKLVRDEEGCKKKQVRKLEHDGFLRRGRKTPV
jgi:hypothetical protein